MAHELQKYADEGSLDLDKLKETIDEVTDDRQSSIIRLDINRARFAAKEAASLGEEWKHAMAGESLYTPTACASRQQKKLR
jgi:hypothetical protein